MNEAKRFLEIIKTAAVDAVNAQQPVEFIFGTVIQEENLPEDIPLQIELSQKLVLGRNFFVQNAALEGLKEGQRLAILKIQGGQMYYILEVLENDSN